MSTNWDVLNNPTERSTDDWRTPREFFEKLREEFNFSVDAAASAQNAMLPRYWTREIDGLAQDWVGAGSVWCNPPYGRETTRWVEKAYRSAQAGAVVVVLIFARTDTKWWHHYAMRASEIRFVRGRLHFEKPDGTRGAPAPVPSAVLIFRPEHSGDPKVVSW